MEISNDLQKTQDIYKKLTDREIEIARQAKEGMSLKESARLMGVAVSTIGATRGRIMDKLGCRNITACVVSLIEAGIL